MPASIKSKAKNIPRITAGKSYAVQGITGGGVVIVDDEGKFSHVSFFEIDAGWTVTDDGAEKKSDDKADTNKKSYT